MGWGSNLFCYFIIIVIVVVIIIIIIIIVVIETGNGNGKKCYNYDCVTNNNEDTN